MTSCAKPFWLSLYSFPGFASSAPSLLIAAVSRNGDMALRTGSTTTYILAEAEMISRLCFKCADVCTYIHISICVCIMYIYI